MLHYLFFVIFVVLFFRNFEKTAILVAALSCLMTVFRDPLNVVGNLYLTLSLFAIVLGIFKYKKQINGAPFLWCILPVLLSYTVTMYVNGFYPKQYVIIISRYLFPCILYCVINSQSRIYSFVKYASVLMIAAALYCLFEEVISANPIMNWCVNHSDSFTWLHDRVDHRFGIKRAQSFFSCEAAFGTACSFMFIILFTLLRDKAQIMKTYWRKWLIGLLPICVFMTGTRSVIMCFLLACLSLLTPATIKKYRFQLLVLALFVALFMGSYLGEIYDSIFVSSADFGGSSSDMREGQWDIAFYYMDQDYWVGNGINFTGNLLNKGGEAGLFGAEGMWLPIMMDRGMIGVISVWVAFFIGLLSILHRKQYSLIWIWVSFLLMKTITTGVGIEPTYYEVILVVLFRYAEFRKVSLNKGKYDFNNSTNLQGREIS